ncbi:hypothetical protein [Planococcus sp. ISL-110]|uniref:hypothetical protein n=1 Tax=Planococcus sp. ISL-110 TaxID=2819167 RepID=UPI001BE8388E|nr:hypothetical protein [Planococcus sp. ISL-110]MBT2570747.1 hypothetical protein [Planococcus sp. ISL-110]
MEIDPQHPIYQQGLKTLIDHMWNPEESVEDDVCVVAMLVDLLTYGKYQASIIDEMIHYLLQHQMPDGGWNCSAVYGHSTKSSIHTPLSVLEAYSDYEKPGYGILLPSIQEQTKEGQAYFLQRNLMRRKSNNEITLPYIVDFHFPTRWKYDVLRALSYFRPSIILMNPHWKKGWNCSKRNSKEVT